MLRGLPINKGQHLSSNTEFKKGQISWNKGRKIQTNTGRTHFKKGCISLMKGKHHTKEAKEKNSKAHLGHKHSEETKNKIGLASLGNKYSQGRKYSLETRKRWSETRKGEKCYNWKGGITSLHHQVRNCFEYRQWRSDVFTRDDFTCQYCNQKGGNLVAHHKIEFADIIERYEILKLEEAIKCEELWNINNGITFCLECHMEFHKKLNKGRL